MAWSIIDWEKVKKKIKDNDWAEEIFRNIKNNTGSWIEKTKRQPERKEWITGWYHNYFCPDDSTRLEWNIDTPEEHRCPKCGKVYSDQKRKEAWIQFYRSRNAQMMKNAAILYRITGDAAYPEWVRNQLVFYREHYQSYEPHGEWVGKTKLMGETLSESQWMIHVMDTLSILGDVITDEEKSSLYRKIFKPASELLIPQRKTIPNIRATMNTAVCMAGLYFRDDALIESAMEDELGIKPQIREAVTEEGFWYECSVQYHFLAAHSLLSIFRWLAAYDKLEPELKTAYRKMLLFPRDIAFPDGSLPNPHDGFTNPNLSKLKHILEEALAIFQGDSELLELYALLKDKYRDARGLNTLLFGRAAEGVKPFDLHSLTSRSFPGSRICMLRNEKAAVFFKYGHHLHGRPSHAHPDQMTVEYYFIDELISRDLGTPGYSSPLMLKWFRTSPSHNTVTMDQRNQDSLEPGTITAFDPQNNRTAAKADQVYREGVTYQRELELAENTLTDCFTVTAGEDHTFDWFTHIRGTLTREDDLAWEDTVLEPEDEGSPYHHLYDLQGAKTDRDVVFEWDFPQKTVTAELKGAPGTEVFRFKSYDLPATERRDGIMIRRKGSQAEFKILWRFTGKRGIV